MNPEETLSAWLSASRDRYFLLVIAGRISGVRAEKGKYRPVGYQIDGSTVMIQFDGSESLTISDAADISMHPNGELVVRDASEARIAWSLRGDSEIEAVPCTEVFRKAGKFFYFSRTGEPFITSGGLIYPGDQFIVLRPA